MKVWITKYALTRGIIEIDVSDFHRTYVKPNGTMCFYDKFGNMVCSYKKLEHFGLKELAIQKAEEMRHPVCNFFLGGVSTDYHISQGFCLR